jgi:3-hydroxymyristoyl/3-hydroxydecanoyl-(acyl carrier protein) dehydratase
MELDDRVREVMRGARRRPLFEGPLPAVDVEVERLVPHRGPARLVDRIVGVDLDELRIDARRRLDARDRGFEGHFRDHPVWPGVLQIELMGQTGLCLVALARGGVPAPGAAPVGVRLLRVRDALFVSEARPGDELRVLARVLDDTGATVSCAAQCLSGAPDERVVSAAVFEAIDEL